MIEELNTPQMAVRAGCSERTIQRWLRDGKLPAEHVVHNRYRIDTDDLERVRLADHYEEYTRIVALEQKVEQLAEQVAQLDATVRVLAEQLARLTAPAPRHHLRQAERPSEAIVPTAVGLVPAVQFAEAHGVGKDAAKSAFKRQYIHTTKVQGDQAHYLDEQQRRDALAYWRSHNTPGFHPCGDPGCACHE